VSCPVGVPQPAILGQVVATDTTAPLADAYVVIESDSSSPWPLLSARTNRSWQFVLAPAPPGSHVVRAAFIGYVPRRQRVLIPVAGCLRIRIPLFPRPDDLDDITVSLSMPAQVPNPRLQRRGVFGRYWLVSAPEVLQVLGGWRAVARR
jgi:hypothetical protein